MMKQHSKEHTTEVVEWIVVYESPNVFKPASCTMIYYVHKIPKQRDNLHNNVHA